MRVMTLSLAPPVRLALILLVVAFSCATIGCTTPTKALSAQGQLALRIDEAVKVLQDQLSRRNHQRITSLLATPLSDNQTFAQGLTTLFERATSLRATFVIERLWIQNPETVRVDLHWTLHAELASPPGPATITGTARFTMIGKEPRLAAVQGDNPFNQAFDRPLTP
jgi:hypothetical protein